MPTERSLPLGAHFGLITQPQLADKDIVCTRGVRTTAHSNMLRDWVPETDATVYTVLAQAGAVSLGKLAFWEFAYGNPGPAPAFPPARNPWNTD